MSIDKLSEEIRKIKKEFCGKHQTCEELNYRCPLCYEENYGDVACSAEIMIDALEKIKDGG